MCRVMVGVRETRWRWPAARDPYRRSGLTLDERSPGGQPVAELSGSTSLSDQTEPAGWVIMCVFIEGAWQPTAHAADSLSFMESRILDEPLVVRHHRADRSRVTWPYLRERWYAEGASEAPVAESASARATASAERRYAVRALFRAAFGELGSLGRSPGAVRLAHLAALTVGFTLTVAGYVSRRAVSTSPRCLWTRKRAR
jgi:hypothetical protein